MTRPIKYRHIVHREVPADILALGEDSLKKLALTTIRKVLTGEIVGKELDNRRATGDLTGCRKVLFDVRSDIPPRFRLVYREMRTGVEIVAIETISVGDRFELEAYFNAAIRIKNQTEKPS
ncbi:MAG: hypothetical protein NTX12_00265 [Actinobacteria bacterium]|nr:hypothetical protein [Actinomycetota bacterium]